MRTGVAQHKVDLNEYRAELERRVTDLASL